MFKHRKIILTSIMIFMILVIVVIEVKVCLQTSWACPEDRADGCEL